LLVASAKLTATTLTTDCYRVLKDAILKLELVPGTPLVEGQIASQLGISKTPVREALARLAGEGLVLTEAGRGSVVAGISEQTIRELYQLRIILESASLREVALDLTSADLDDLIALARTAEDARERNDQRAFIEANELFHLSLIRKGRNQALIAIVESIFEQVRRVRIAIYQAAVTHGVADHEAEIHQPILEALTVRDADRAAAMIRADIHHFLDRLETPVIQAALRHLASTR